MVYAYPPARAKMAQNDGAQAAIQRRKTVIGDFSLNAEEEAKLLGIEDNNDNNDNPPPIEEIVKEVVEGAKTVVGEAATALSERRASLRESVMKG